jgi:hypothetical protein
MEMQELQFEFAFLKKASVAQMVEQLTCNQWVGGSIPFAGSKWGKMGEVPERSKGADCKSAGAAFGGSNPPLSTRGTSQERVTRVLIHRGVTCYSFFRRLLGKCGFGYECGNSSVG